MVVTGRQTQELSLLGRPRRCLQQGKGTDLTARRRPGRMPQVPNTGKPGEGGRRGCADSGQEGVGFLLIQDGFAEIARSAPERTALRLAGHSLSYGELDRRSLSLAHALRRCFRLEEGQPVALALSNSLEFAEASLAAVRLGAPLAPLNPGLPPPAILALLQRLQPGVVITSVPLLVALRQAGAAGEERAGQQPSAASASPGYPELTGYYGGAWRPAAGGRGGGEPVLAAVVAANGRLAGVRAYQDLLAGRLGDGKPGPASGLPLPADTSVFYLAPTSGSTGRPKIVRRSHRSWADSFAPLARVFDLGSGDSIVLAAPLFYSASFYTLLQALNLGAIVEVLPAFRPVPVLRALARATACFLVPSQYQALAARAAASSPVPGADSSGGLVGKEGQPFPEGPPLKMISAGSKLAPAVRERLAAVFPGARVYEYYGATELSFVSVLSPEEGCRRPESVGRLLPQVSLRLVDSGEARQYPAPAGVRGRIEVRSPWLAAGYLDDPLAEREVFRGEWAGVGDTGWLDEEGFLCLAGRGDGVINRAGEKFAAGEVEEALLGHPQVAAVAVVALPDGLRGEVPAALVAPLPGSEVSEAQLFRHCRRVLPRSRRPVVILLAGELPRNAAGKVDRGSVSEILAARRNPG